MSHADEKSKKKSRKPNSSGKEKRSRIVEDETHGFWTKRRPWVFVLLVSMELLNFVNGPEFWYKLGVKYKDLGWTEASRICCHMSTWANPWNKMGKRAEMYSRVRLPKHDISTDAQSKNIDGFNLEAMGNPDRAIVVFEALIKEQPNFEWPYNNLASIRAQRGELDESARLCQKAISINPDYANAHYTLGLVLQAQGKTEEARTHSSKAAVLLAECD